MANLNVPITSITKNLTLNLNVTGVRTWKVRVWCGVQLIRFAAFVMGCGFHLDARNDNELQR